jgi:hypothetical protein
MTKRCFLILAVLVQSIVVFAQSDSVLTYSNLKFHSAFEKKAYTNFVNYQTDTLDAFLAVDEMVGQEDVVFLKGKFEDIWNELVAKKIGQKKMNAQIKLVYATVKKNCLKKYVQEEPISSLLINGRYSETTASVIFALIFDRLHIPYLILDSHVDFALIANPGPNEIKLEVNNPLPNTNTVSEDFKHLYVDLLHRTGKVTDAELRFHTYDELYEEKSKVQSPVTVRELLGLEYYFQSARKQMMKENDLSLDLIQKGYYLDQATYVQIQLLNSLSQKMERLTINDATDIDYIIQMYRVLHLDVEHTKNLFANAANNLLQFTDKLPLLEAVHARFISQINDQELIDEVNYNYYLMRTKLQNLSYPDIFYVDKAVCIKPNLREVNNYLESILNVYLTNINNDHVRLDSINSLSIKLQSNTAKNALATHRLMALLNLAKESFKNKKPVDGEKFLKDFEASCPCPVENKLMTWTVESAYRDIAVAVYWNNNQDYTANAKMVKRGLKYVPDSQVLLSGMYEKGTVKYLTESDVKAAAKKEAEKPKTGRSLRVISKNKKEKVYSF